MNTQELRDTVARLREEISELAAVEDISEDDDVRLDGLLDELEVADAELTKAEARDERVAKVTADIAAGRLNESPGVDNEGPQIIERVDPFDTDHVRGLAAGEVRDRAMKLVEGVERQLGDHQLAHVERLLGTRNGDTDDILVLVEGELEVPVVSGTFEPGDFLGADEAASGTELEDRQLRAVTSPDLGIMQVTKQETAAVTSVTAKLIRSLTKNPATGGAAAQRFDCSPYTCRDRIPRFFRATVVAADLDIWHIVGCP